MNQFGWTAAGLLAVSMAAGSLAPQSQATPRKRFAGGYQVLAGDFHVHSFPLSWSTLSPFDTVWEAERLGLDVIAMSGHNNVVVSQVGRWFSERIGGPLVLAAEEVHAPSYHMVAVGIEHTVSWRQPAASAIDEVHRQGGIAIAAHPLSSYWPGWDSEAMRRLDAAEVVHPSIFYDDDRRRQVRQFFARRKLTAIGSSDVHYSWTIDYARTYVFVTERSARGVLDALRQGRTVVYDRDGQAFGDPELIQLDAAAPLAPRRPSGFWSHFSLVTGVLGLLMGVASFRAA